MGLVEPERHRRRTFRDTTKTTTSETTQHGLAFQRSKILGGIVAVTSPSAPRPSIPIWDSLFLQVADPSRSGLVVQRAEAQE